MLSVRIESATSALCYSFIRARYGARAGEPGPRWNRTVRFVLDQQARMPDYLRMPLIVATLILDHLACLTDLGCWHQLDPDRRWALIEKARRSMFKPLRDLLRFYETLSVFGFGDELEPAADDPNRPARDCVAECEVGPDRKLRVVAVVNRHPRRKRSEIAVIGSGPGGAITACLLAEAGRDVILIESGPHLEPYDEAQFTRAEMQCKYRNGGVTAALGAIKVAYAEGHCVGGGSEINAGLYHRAPEDVLDSWRRTHRLDAAGMGEMVAHFEACERDVGISYMPGEAPPSSLKLHEGAQRIGWKSLEVPRCFKYSPNGRAQKQSMTRTYIPRALAAGCKLVANARARRLTHRGSHWTVHMERLVPGARPARDEILCETLFVCGGAIHTPALLLSSGIGRNVGRSLRMHPTVKVMAKFPEVVNSREVGVPVHQVKEFSPRLSFGCSISKPPHLSLAMLDHPEHSKEVDEEWSKMAVYYAMITGGSGRVQTLPMFRDPLVTYKLGNGDLRDLADGLRKLCRLLFAAGAETLYPSIAGMAPLHSPDDLRSIPDALSDSASLMTVHLFSSCPMGEDKSRCVANSFGAVHEHEALHIADASLLCTAPGVNPQGSVMAFARRNAMHFLSNSRH